MSEDLRVRIDRRASELGCRLQSAQIEQLARYLELLARWNGRINLTALPLEGFPPRTLDRLLMEPLVAASRVNTSRLTWLDFGSGGGSPALPLKIIRPAARLTMVESRSRKCAFLREAARQLQLVDTQVALSRVEDVPAQPRSVDLITVRALKLDDSIAERAAELLAPCGHLLTFGPSLEAQASPPGFTLLSSLPLPTESSALHCYQRI